MEEASVAVVGAGIFGLSSALALRARGHTVHLIDRARPPAADAASTDISKVIRADYGADVFYTSWMDEAFAGWDRWNREAPEPLFQRSGFLLLCRRPPLRGSFEGDSHALLSARGERLETVDAGFLAARFPAWRDGPLRSGYFNPRAGWAASGKVVAWLWERAAAAGIQLHPERALVGFESEGGRVAGVRLADGGRIAARQVLLAVGAWTPTLLPELADRLAPVAQPVLHFRAPDDAWGAPRFPAWAADISQSGWYGFPALADRTLKIAHHGRGQPADPDGARVAPADAEARARRFLRAHLPALAEAPLLETHTCLYCDSFDGDFWLGAHPERPGLFVLAGGSGHGFKFGPVIGELAADVLGAVANPRAARLAWRELGPRKGESARCGD